MLAHLVHRGMRVVDICHTRRAGSIQLEPHFAVEFRHRTQALLHTVSMDEAAVGDEYGLDARAHADAYTRTGDDFHHLGKLRAAGGFTVARQGDVVDASHVFRHTILHKITMQNVVQKIVQLLFQQNQIDVRCSAAHEVGHLAIHASPVAGIVGVEIDTDRQASGATRDDGIDVAQIRAIAVVIDDAERNNFGCLIRAQD